MCMLVHAIFWGCLSLISSIDNFPPALLPSAWCPLPPVINVWFPFRIILFRLNPPSLYDLLLVACLCPAWLLAWKVDNCPDCLALYCYVCLENIGFVYPAMSMSVIGLLLLYLDKVGAVCCMMFIESHRWCCMQDWNTRTQSRIRIELFSF